MKKYNQIVTSDNILSIVHIDKSMCHDIWQNSLDENNRRFVPDEVFETLEDATEIVNFIIDSYRNENGPFIYAIIRNSDHSDIGYVQLVKIEEGWEIGYHIAEKYTGKGYATHAVKLFLTYLKDNTDIKEVYGIALADNIASRRVLTKTGFILYYEGEGPYQGEQRNIIKTIWKN